MISVFSGFILSSRALTKSIGFALLSVGVGAAAEAQPAAYDLARQARNGRVRAGRS
jgi:hypothetical protein